MNTDADPMHSEIFHRIGRNLVLFQQIEQLLKSILASHSVSGTVETYKARQQAQADCINRKTLGQLVDKYGSEVLQDAAQEAPEEERPAGWFSFSFQRSANSEYLESMRRNLRLMTDERNVEVLDEPLSRGGFKTLYKNRPTH